MLPDGLQTPIPVGWGARLSIHQKQGGLQRHGDLVAAASDMEPQLKRRQQVIALVDLPNIKGHVLHPTQVTGTETNHFVNGN